MPRSVLLMLALAFAAWAANVKLYLAGGGYHLVREYQVLSDRVRFYSVERSQWEEMPLDLVDLERTRAEEAARKAEIEKEAKVIVEEAAAEREVWNEAARVPMEPGVYWLDGLALKPLKQAESNIHTNTARSVLSRLSPIPMVPGKSTLELNGAHSATVLANPSQEFYFRLSEAEEFGIARLTVKGSVRVVEEMEIVPQTKEVSEFPMLVQTQRRELEERLFKIWPASPLPPGEYAVVEFSAGKTNMQVWDFAVKK